MIWMVLSLVVLGIWVIILHFSVRELERRVEVALGKDDVHLKGLAAYHEKLATFHEKLVAYQEKLVAYQEKLDIHQSAQIDLEARLRHAEHRQGRTVA